MRSSDIDVLFIIPAWNEADVVGDVVREARDTVSEFADVLVVSDGSTDNTAAEARAAGAIVLELPLNLGVGGAMRAGYLYAQRAGYSYAVQLDADGQHDPAEFDVLWNQLFDTDANIVIGARFAGKGNYKVRGPRNWAMKLLAAIMSDVCQTKLTDATSGFKLIDCKAIELFARNYPAEYLGDTIDALVIASRAGLRISQAPVEMRPRAGGKPSHNPVKSAVFLLRAFLALGIALSRPSTGRRRPDNDEDDEDLT